MHKDSKQQIELVVIEDEPSISNLYQQKFELEGFKVQLAFNGVDGLKIVEATRPDIILLDLRMPEMNGDEMLEKLRATEWGADIRVVILTNISRDEAPSSLRFLNVDRYVVKAHHTPSQVVAIVRDVLGLK